MKAADIHMMTDTVIKVRPHLEMRTLVLKRYLGSISRPCQKYFLIFSSTIRKSARMSNMQLTFRLGFFLNGFPSFHQIIDALNRSHPRFKKPTRLLRRKILSSSKVDYRGAICLDQVEGQKDRRWGEIEGAKVPQGFHKP